MKVLLIEPCNVNFGGYFRAYNICNSLSKRNIKVDLLCAHEKKFAFSIKSTKINKNFVRYELPRFYLHFFVNGRILRGTIGFLFGLFRNYDIIHAFVPIQLETNIPLFLLKLLGKKVVVDWDDYWEGSTIYGEYKILKKYVKNCETIIPRFIGNVVVVSEFLGKLAEKRGAKNILKLINGVDTMQFKLHSKKESRIKLKFKSSEKYLLAFGNTYSRDRIYYLFKIFESIYHLDPKVFLLFNNDPRLYFNIYNLEKFFDDKIFKNIINVGYINQTDLGYYLSAANATLFITGDTDDERACFPIRIGSYLNGESVVVLNDINSEVSNTLKKYNCVIIDKDIKKLAKKTVRFLNDRQMQKKMKNQVKIAKKELSWNTQIDKLILYYNKIVN